MFGAIGQLASLAKNSTAAESSAELVDVPKDDYDFGLQRWMQKRGKFYRPNLSTNEVMEYKDAFRIIDLDGSGTLEVDELVQAMRALDQPVSAYEMTKLVELIAPGKGFLNETDFIELVHYRSLPNGSKPNHKKENEEANTESKDNPKKVQVSMGILAGTFRRKKALDLLMLPWEIRNNTIREAERQSELAQILAPQNQLEPVGNQKFNHRSPKISTIHESTDALHHAGQTTVNYTDYTEHLFSMPLLPPGLSKKLRHQAIKQTIPTSYSAPLMSRIQEKIHAEVALETAEISKTAFYLPPVHKRKQIPYVENVDSRSLSPNSGRRSAASGFTEKDEFERQKRLTLKKYNFPSNAPILKSPREMQEPYAFLSQQLIASNKNSKHEKARAQTKTAKVKVTIDVSQVMKDAETLLQTAKLALRQSRVQAQKAAAVTPSCALGHERPERQSFSPSSLNASPGSPFGARLDSQTPNVLNNSPIAQALNSVQKSALSTEKYASNHTGPIIRIFKAELAPIASNRTKIKNVGAGARATELNDAKRDALQNVATVKADLHDIGSEPKMKSLIGMEKSST